MEAGIFFSLHHKASFFCFFFQFVESLESTSAMKTISGVQWCDIIIQFIILQFSHFHSQSFKFIFPKDFYLQDGSVWGYPDLKKDCDLNIPSAPNTC